MFKSPHFVAANIAAGQFSSQSIINSFWQRHDYPYNRDVVFIVPNRLF
jgi:hypothetical protein